MNGEDLVNITVVIAGRHFPLKVRDTDEPSVREIAKDVNEKIKQFQQTYKNKDKLDCLCMTALTYAVELQKEKLASSDQDISIRTKLAHLEESVDRVLNK